MLLISLLWCWVVFVCLLIFGFGACLLFDLLTVGVFCVYCGYGLGFGL